MSKSKSKKVVSIIIASVVGVFLVSALAGGVALRGAIKVINRDKQFLMDTITSSFSKDRKGPQEIVTMVPALESKYGKFKEIVKVDGVPVMGDTLKGGEEFSFQVSVNFEKGPITFDARVSNADESPKLLAISYKEGHFPRKKISSAIKGLFK